MNIDSIVVFQDIFLGNIRWTPGIKGQCLSKVFFEKKRHPMFGKIKKLEFIRC